MRTALEDIPEPDALPGVPHPRHAARVVGQDAAIAAFIAAAAGDRLHHAWLLTGPRGVGKATLAWAIARRLLAGGADDSLAVAPDHPVARRIAALSEPNLALIRRPWDEKTDRLRTEITVDEVRRLAGFFHLSASGAGRRVAIIDAADELNPSAANALLKMLEEPPPGAVILLVAHQPAGLLPTIRSRCRTLRLAPLAPDDMAAVLGPLGIDAEAAPALAALSGGSAGEALRLAHQDGLQTYQGLVDLFGTLPGLDRPAAAQIAAAAAGRRGGEADAFDLTVTLLDRLLARLARAGLTGAPIPQAARGEGAVMARLSPDAAAARGWAEAQAGTLARGRAGRALNLDPAALVMDMLTELARSAPTQAR